MISNYFFEGKRMENQREKSNKATQIQKRKEVSGDLGDPQIMTYLA